MIRRRGLALLVLALAAGPLALPAEAAPPPLGSIAPKAAEPAKDCGEKLLYERTLRIRVRGEVSSCPKVMGITAGDKCRFRFQQRWSCFSARKSDPILYWFRSKELFKPRLSTLIVARRYPCEDAAFTEEEWLEGTHGFPTLRQLIADDLIRCDLLEGMDTDAVETLLGAADEESTHQDVTYLDYWAGPERDSVIQIDPEYFSVKFGPDDLFLSARFYQG